MGGLLLAAGLLALLVICAAAAVAGARVNGPHAGVVPLLRPAPCSEGHSRSEHRRAASLVRDHAVDSLDPFALREDKRYFFDSGGMLAYRTVRETAVVAADPIGSPGAAPAVVGRFLSHAAEHGWAVVMTGASARHLDAYRDLDLHALHIGNEAVVDPRTFCLEGRAVRKVRQSVARVKRRGWSVEVVRARELGDCVMEELAAVDRRWHAAGRRIAGFAMTLGRLWGVGDDLDGLYVLGRNPDGRVHAFQHFVAYRDGLSLDLSRRLGDEPNGLSEAMVVAVLAHARGLGLAEVSLNFAGFGHLMAPEADLTLRQRLGRAALSCVHGRFQLERLVHFNDKFFPRWRPRYLVYQRRGLLPLAALRVLQAEGYLRAPRRRALTTGWQPRAQPVAQSITAARPQASR
jgi:lysyl-tRNA synthetase class 2